MANLGRRPASGPQPWSSQTPRRRNAPSLARVSENAPMSLPGAAVSEPQLLTPDELDDDELDAIEDELARAERTLSLLADDEMDPRVATAWLTDAG